MSADTGRLGGRLSSIDPADAVSIPIVVAPFGYLIGSLFVTHLVGSESAAVWMTTVALTSLAFLVVSMRS
ncbi:MULTISPECIES: hypothetical protein [Haloferax]|uniref:Uncharacterized protein n=1 Tax=Haloferax marinum TaxID=2666143 RepID=A0A6A8G503_9EURY|nr:MULTISPECIES: hypothetical protein [Haloferax]KAB1196652.1 hypothetical protein Hfx1150_03615 [Haloferax sp. CBA1150]MRW95658.1 hypothetical protein [Haloferax marinum]